VRAEPARVAVGGTAHVLRGPGEVAEAQAGAALATIHARVREALGVPLVPTVFRMLSRHEHYLAAALDALRAAPPADLGEHAAKAREIGVRAAVVLAPAPLHAGDAAAAVEALLDRYNQANARSLLLVAAMARGVRPATGVMEPRQPPRSPAGAGGLLDDIRACHGDFTVPGVWRELADGWPQLAVAAWAGVRPLPDDAAFGEARGELIAMARAAVVGTATPTPADLGCTEHEARDIERILAWFVVAIPTMVIEIECLRRALATGATADPA
jgi:hypothetical protein